MLNFHCNWAPIPLRLMLGFGMAYHGFPKVFDATSHDQFVGMLGGMGVPFPAMAAWTVGILEFAGGLMLIVGLITRLISALMIVNMLVAIYLVHLPSGFVAPPGADLPGYELNVLYIAGLLSLVIGGAGRYSIDGMMQRAARRAVPAAGPTAAERSLPKRVSRWRKRADRPPVVGD